MGKTRRSWLTALLALGVVVVLTGVAIARADGFVRVKVDTANIRRGPGKDFSILGRAYQNDPLKVLGRKGPWLSILDFQGYKGWIYAPLTDDRPAVIVTATTANVRSGPGTKHPVVFTAERGVPFRLLQDSGKWLKVRHADGDSGWIYRSLVWGPNRN